MKALFFFLLAIAPLSAIPFSNELMVEGHSVYLTKNPDVSTEWKLRLIQEAKQSIEISAGYTKGKIVQTLLETLHEKLETNPTIKVHLMISRLLDFLKSDEEAYLASLASSYPGRFNYLITEATGLINQEDKAYITENHTKLIIIDEKYYLLGGTNLVEELSSEDPSRSREIDSTASHHIPAAAKDMDAVIRGPMAKKLRKEFFNLYALYRSNEPLNNSKGDFKPSKTNYFPLSNEEKADISLFEEHPDTDHNVRVYSVISGPRMQLHTIGNMYEKLILQAHTSIDIANMYFFPCTTIRNALLDAVNRDVRLHVVTNGTHDELTTINSSREWYGHLNRMNYFPLMAGRDYSIWELFAARDATPTKAAFFELNLKGILLHKKVMTTDSLYTLIGSYNLGMKSEDADYEVAAVIESPKIAAKMQTILLDDKKKSKQIPFNQALGWYFDPFYNFNELLEGALYDGIIL